MERRPPLLPTSHTAPPFDPDHQPAAAVLNRTCTARQDIHTRFGTLRLKQGERAVFIGIFMDMVLMRNKAGEVFSCGPNLVEIS